MIIQTAKDALLLVYAALTVEAERGALDATMQDDKKYLEEMSSVSDSGREEEVSDSDRREWLELYRARIAAHREAGVSPTALGTRMDKIMAYFSLMGFNQHYAGYEGYFRLRFCRLVATSEFTKVPVSRWVDSATQIEAATYMAYTDFHPLEIQAVRTHDAV